MDGERTTVDDGPPGGLRERWEDRTVDQKARSSEPTADKEIGPSDSSVSSTNTVVAEDSGEILLDTGVGRDGGGHEDAVTRDEAERRRLADGTGETIDAGAGHRGAGAQAAGPHGAPGAGQPPFERSPPMSAKLVVVSGSDRGRQFEIAGETVTVGRGVNNDVILTDIAVSRNHLRIERDGAAYVLTDLGSGNGTIVNDRDQEGSAPLRDGDRLEIGNTVIRFEGPHARFDNQMGAATKAEAPRPRKSGPQRRQAAPQPKPSLPAPGRAKPQPPAAMEAPPLRAAFGPAPMGAGLDEEIDEDAATIAGRKPPEPPPGEAPIQERGLPAPRPAPPELGPNPAPAGAGPRPPAPAETPSVIRALGAPPIAPSPPSAPFYPMAPQAFGQQGPAPAPPAHYPGRILGQADTEPDRKKLVVAILAVAAVVVLIGVVAAVFATGGDQRALADTSKDSAAGASKEQASDDGAETAGESEDEQASPRGLQALLGEKAEKKEEGGDREEKKEEQKGEEGHAMVALIAGKREMPPSTWGNEESFLHSVPSVDELESQLKTAREESEKSEKSEESEKNEGRDRKHEETHEGHSGHTGGGHTGGGHTGGHTGSSHPRHRAAGPDLGVARRRAQDFYRKRQFSQAAALLRKAASDARGVPARRARNAARSYERLGDLIARANGAVSSNPSAAWSSYKRALSADRGLGGAHAGYLRARIRQTAKKAAMSLMAKNRYVLAKQAADDAASGSVGFIYRSLEQKALGLYRKAEQAKAQGRTEQARSLLRQVKDMSRKGSVAWKKAIKALAQL